MDRTETLRCIVQNFPYCIDFTIHIGDRKIINWCEERFGPDALTENKTTINNFSYDEKCKWTFFGHKTYFKIEEDAVLFKLRV